jgi:aspartate aminotransferase
MAQYAAMKALEGGDEAIAPMVAQFQERRDAMVEKINQIPGLSCRKPQGAFYIMMNIKRILGKSYHGRTIENSKTFAELLLAEKHVAVVPGSAFEAEGFCRLSYAVAKEQCMEGLNRIEEFVGELTDAPW